MPKACSKKQLVGLWNSLRLLKAIVDLLAEVFCLLEALLRLQHRREV